MKNLLKDSGNMDKMRDQFFDIVGVFLTGGNATLNHPELKKMMAEESFDLVITGFIANSFFVGIAEHFDCPVVIMSLQPPSSFINVLVGNPVAASGVPHFFLNKKSIETILGKVKNVLIYAGEYIVMSIVDWKSKQLYE